jgi:HlyD family secretion protein
MNAALNDTVVSPDPRDHQTPRRSIVSKVRSIGAAPRSWLICAAAIAAAAASISMTGCGAQSPAQGATEQGQSNGEPKDSSAVELPVVTPTLQDFTRVIEQPGYLKPYEQTPIYSKIAGFTEEPKVDINDHVKKGDLLVRLRVPEMEADLEGKQSRVVQAKFEIVQAKESLKAAIANVTTSEALVKEAEAGILEAEAEVLRWNKEYDRAVVLFAKNVYDKQTLDEALNQFQQSKAGLEAKRARLNSSQAALDESKARKSKAVADVDSSEAKWRVCEAERDFSAAMLDYRNIRAPYDGVITLRNVHTDHLLQPTSSGSTNKSAEPLFVMMRYDIMRVTVQIPEFDAVLVQPGMPAIVRFQAYNDKEIQGTVTRFSWAFDEHARTLNCEVHLPNIYKKENGKNVEVLRPGMYVNVTINASLPHVLTVPNEALISDEGDKMCCFIVEDGKAVRTKVRVRTRNDKVSVVEQKEVKPKNRNELPKWVDFTGKEEIISRNVGALIDGQAVRIASSQPSPERLAAK